MIKNNNCQMSDYIINNLISTMDNAVKFSRHSGAGLNYSKGSFRYFSGSNYPLFNGAFSNQDDFYTKSYFLGLVKYYSSRNVPFVWWWTQPDAIPEKINDELLKLGFLKQEPLIGIGLSAEKILTDPFRKNKIIIQEVTTIEFYQSFIDVLSQVYKLDQEICLDFFSLFNYKIPNLKHYLAFYQDEPIATLTCELDQENMGISNVACIPKARGKGAVNLLINAAFAQAEKSKVKAIVSQIAPPGTLKRASQKLQFAEYCHMTPFIKF